ncbi:DUF1449 family protein [Streptomyces hainanensis]|uniref:DUF1449 family protein n=1 Tax=Streptomyces hainanensis TaxID=402648 RepID=A0A4R4THP0_9ACTN|nr:DUF1449 family protein [Streptomyces hainanensis]TDC77201.1 DUF1449 family protein [Streptomyces hainanensis]
MGDFFDTATHFPAVVFTFPFVVVLAFWLFSLVFGVGASVADSAEPTADGAGGALSAIGLGGVPAAISVSLVIAVGWFAAMVGAELVEPAVGRALVVPAALLLGWLGARLLALLLRPVFMGERGVYHEDFVGRVCLVRTSTVTASFGQAEVTADDGGTAVIQVRAEGPEGEELTAGARALIFGYEPERAFFWVAPYDAGPAQNQPRG